MKTLLKSLFAGTFVQKQVEKETGDIFLKSWLLSKEVAEQQLNHFIMLQANKFVSKTDNAKNIMRAQRILAEIEAEIAKTGKEIQ